MDSSGAGESGARQVVDAVIAGVGRDLVRVHPLGRREPVWTVVRSRFDGEGARRPKVGMLVHAVFEAGAVRRLVRFIPVEDEETRRRALLAALRGLARSMAGELAKARSEGWPVPPVYAEAVERLRLGGELLPLGDGSTSGGHASRRAG